MDKTDVMIFDKLIEDINGLFVKEKIYHNESGDYGCVMWSVWSPNKLRWSRWHVSYFMVGLDKYWTKPDEFNEAIKNYAPLKIVR